MKITTPSASRLAVGGSGALATYNGAKDLKQAYANRADKKVAIQTAALGALKLTAGLTALVTAVRN